MWNYKWDFDNFIWCFVHQTFIFIICICKKNSRSYKSLDKPYDYLYFFMHLFIYIFWKHWFHYKVSSHTWHTCLRNLSQLHYSNHLYMFLLLARSSIRKVKLKGSSSNSYDLDLSQNLFIEIGTRIMKLTFY